jgi:hypothetical protein
MPWLRVRGVPHRLGARIRTLRDQVETAGRDWQEVEVTLLTASTDTEDLFAFEAMGIHRLVFVLPDVGPADMVARIDDYARLARP